MTVAGLAASPVQKAVFAALESAAAFMSLVDNRLYTDVPEPEAIVAATGGQFPLAWLTFGDPTEEPQDTFGQCRALVHLELHVYSEYEGDDECLDVLSEAVLQVHHGTVSVTGWTVPFITRTIGSIVVEDYNGRAVRHGIARFDVHASKN